MIIFLILLAVIRNIFRRKRTNPPGPLRVPFLGSLLFLDLSKGFLSWGLDPRVFAFVKLGRVEINVINDLELAKELFEKEEFSGKNPDQWFSRAGYGTIFPEASPGLRGPSGLPNRGSSSRR